MQSNLLPISHSMPTMALASSCREEDRVVGSSFPRSSSFIDDDARKPLLLPRSSPSAPTNQQIRRRAASDTSLPTVSSRQRSLRRDVGHAAAETYMVTRLSFKLLRYLGVGYRWITKFLALSCYAILLMPGFLQVGYYYFFSSQVRRSIVYGDQPRNRLDLYLPMNINEPKPVVAFVTGGAWIIGYKAWGSLLGQELAEKGVIVACIDYRNFPQGTISDMVKDASQGISFVCNNISEYGGDPNRIYLVGQSAGAHIASCALLNQAIKEGGEGENTSWSVSQIKAYFGISGGRILERNFSSWGISNTDMMVFLLGFAKILNSNRSNPPEKVTNSLWNSLNSSISNARWDEDLEFHAGDTIWRIPNYPYMNSAKETGLKRYNILNLVDHFHRRGLYRSIFLSIMEGEQSLERFSPELMVQDPRFRHAVSLLPLIVLLHGTADHSIPSDASKAFADALRKVGVQVELILYEGKTHTDLFLQDPLRGGRDDLLEDIIAFICAGDAGALPNDENATPRRRLVPEFMLKLAHKVSPF